MPMVLQLAVLLIVAWLPGAALYRAPVVDRAGASPSPRTSGCSRQVILSASSALIIALVLASVGRYRFESVVAGQLVLVLLPLLFWRGRLEVHRGPAPEPLDRDSAGAHRAVHVAIFQAPSTIIAGKDPGTYVNEGVQIAQSGGYVVHDQVVAACRRMRVTSSSPAIRWTGNRAPTTTATGSSALLLGPRQGPRHRTVSPSVPRRPRDRLRPRWIERRAAHDTTTRTAGGTGGDFAGRQFSAKRRLPPEPHYWP